MTDMLDCSSSYTGEDSAATGTAQTAEFHLKYPEIPLHLSLDSLLAHSSSSGSSSTNIMPSSETTPPALDDSWASLVDVDSSNDDDMQSENTDVVSLLDAQSSDEIQSVSDGVHIVDEEFTDEKDVQHIAAGDFSSHRPLQASTQSDITLNRPPSPAPRFACLERPEEPEESEEPKEPQEPGKSSIRIHTITKPLSEHESRKMVPDYQPGKQYARIIHVPLLEDGLHQNTPEYFKVILLGRHVEQFRPEIQRKLGDVLVSHRVASHSTSPTSIARFHLVPNAFGPGSQPDFADLVAIDKQIDFDCYDYAEPSSASCYPGSLQLSNTQTSSQVVSDWNGRGFTITNPRWAAPDLAIICVHLDAKSKMDSQSLQMLDFARRHEIPSILIRMDRSWYGNYSQARDMSSLHETIESRPGQPQKVGPLEHFPLHMATFLNLDSTLLNRHIAYAVSATDKSAQVKIPDLAFSPTEVSEKQPSYLKQYSTQKFGILKNFIILLWILTVYIFMGAHLWPLVSDLIVGRHNQTVTANATAETPSVLTTTQLVPSVSQLITEAARKDSQTGQQLIEIASMSAVPRLAEDAMHFQVGVVNDHQLMIRLPKAALNSKKRSPLSVVLKRKEQSVPMAVQELFDGVFSVQLHPRDTYGDIEVNLTMTRPPASEVLTVSFGDRPALNFYRLQEGLGLLSERFLNSVSSIRESLVDRQHSASLLLTNGSETFRQELADRLERMQSRRAAWKQSFSLTPSQLRMPAAKSIQDLSTKITRLTEKAAEQGRKKVAQVSNGLGSARSCLRSIFESVNMSGFGAELDKKVAEKLGAAQGRAQSIVSKAAGKLRARSACL